MVQTLRGVDVVVESRRDHLHRATPLVKPVAARRLERPKEGRVLATTHAKPRGGETRAKDGGDG